MYSLRDILDPFYSSKQWGAKKIYRFLFSFTDFTLLMNSSKNLLGFPFYLSTSPLFIYNAV